MAGVKKVEGTGGENGPRQEYRPGLRDLVMVKPCRMSGFQDVLDCKALLRVALGLVLQQHALVSMTRRFVTLSSGDCHWSIAADDGVGGGEFAFGDAAELEFVQWFAVGENHTGLLRVQNNGCSPTGRAGDGVVPGDFQPAIRAIHVVVAAGDEHRLPDS